ncbi:hypothetical protein DUNSADRAFT_15350 [Dunaliella salina]|uniref:Sulphur transport domain-containing protein n=1 Tax=Dunaliella salina TaxID=3046 RepID=A0ABQ7G5M9_DUNSA|nr:hypothetical protein DUNSADRAFT_15350 [Dunaliella salina]|eukprot:KAF5829887.1 hypothetical protein DUNSADRAFT_15350 [Dunaliella salina]
MGTLGELALTGKVLGISGVIKGLVAGNWQAWRFSLLAGLLVGGALCLAWYPSAFDAASTLGALSTLRVVAAGLLVGAGAAIGNGCTSGHGISGNARLSVRSLSATLTFMAFGIASASFFKTDQDIAFASSVLGSAVLLVSGTALASRDIRTKGLELAVDFSTGLCPGPSVVNLATLRVPSAIFFAALTAGMMAAKKLEKLI